MKGVFCSCQDNKSQEHRTKHWRLQRSGWHNGKPSVHRYVICLKCVSVWGTSAGYTYGLTKVSQDEIDTWAKGGQS